MSHHTQVPVTRGPVAYVVLGVMLLGIAAFGSVVVRFVIATAAVPGGLDRGTVSFVLRAGLLVVALGGVASLVRGVVGLARGEKGEGSGAHVYVDLGIEPWLLDELRSGGRAPSAADDGSGTVAAGSGGARPVGDASSLSSGGPGAPDGSTTPPAARPAAPRAGPGRPRTGPRRRPSALLSGRVQGRPGHPAPNGVRAAMLRGKGTQALWAPAERGQRVDSDDNGAQQPMYRSGRNTSATYLRTRLVMDGLVVVVGIVLLGVGAFREVGAFRGVGGFAIGFVMLIAVNDALGTLQLRAKVSARLEDARAGLPPQAPTRRWRAEDASRFPTEAPSGPLRPGEPSLAAQSRGVTYFDHHSMLVSGIILVVVGLGGGVLFSAFAGGEWLAAAISVAPMALGAIAVGVGLIVWAARDLRQIALERGTTQLYDHASLPAGEVCSTVPPQTWEPQTGADVPQPALPEVVAPAPPEGVGSTLPEDVEHSPSGTAPDVWRPSSLYADPTLWLPTGPARADEPKDVL